MFKILEEKADEIEKGLKRHQNSYLFALNDYNYHNKGNGLEILDEKNSELKQMSDDLTDFIEETNKFDNLISEFEELSKNIELELKRIAFNNDLEDCLFKEDSFDSIEKTEKDSSPAPCDSQKDAPAPSSCDSLKDSPSAPCSSPSFDSPNILLMKFNHLGVNNVISTPACSSIKKKSRLKF